MIKLIVIPTGRTGCIAFWFLLAIFAKATAEDAPAIAPIISVESFVDNFDMNGDYGRYLFDSQGMRVWNESPNGLAVRYWAPTATGETGTLTYRYQFAYPVKHATIRANCLPHLPSDELCIEVSRDGKTYSVITKQRQHPDVKPPHHLTEFNLTKEVKDSREIFIRVKLKGTQLNSSIMSCQFLRTAQDIPFFKAPHVYQFTATTNMK